MKDEEYETKCGLFMLALSVDIPRLITAFRKKNIDGILTILDGLKNGSGAMFDMVMAHNHEEIIRNIYEKLDDEDRKRFVEDVERHDLGYILNSASPTN